jgi:TraB/PrgY/gumN family
LKVTNENDQEVAFIFPSLHNATANSSAELPSCLNDIFLKATSIVFEHSWSKENRKKLKAYNFERLDKLSSDKTNLIISKLNYNNSIDLLRGYKPVPLQLEPLENPIEKKLFEWAESKGKMISYLEEVPYEKGFFLILEALTSPNKLEMTQYTTDEESYFSMLDMWQRGDVENASEYSQLIPLNDDVNDGIIERNYQMAEQIDKLIHEDQLPLVSIGCLHCAGSESVLDLLYEKGYAIERIN